VKGEKKDFQGVERGKMKNKRKLESRGGSRVLRKKRTPSRSLKSSFFTGCQGGKGKWMENGVKGRRETYRKKEGGIRCVN